MVPVKTHSLFAEAEVKLKCHLEQFNKNILIKKDKKLQRDRKAFEEGRAYKCQSNQTNGRRPPKLNKNARISHYESSVHSPIASSPQFFSQQKGRRRQKRCRHGVESHDESSHMEGSPLRTGNYGCSRLNSNSDISDIHTPASSSGSSLHASTTLSTLRSQSVPPGTFLDQMRGRMQTRQKLQSTPT